MTHIKENELQKINGGTDNKRIEYKCSKCGMKFTSERLYKEHMLVYHNEKV